MNRTNDLKDIQKRLAWKRQLTNIITTEISARRVPWTRSYFLDPNSGIPKNIRLNTRYRGINPWLLEAASNQKGYKSRWWGSILDWQEKGVVVPEGEAGTMIAVFSPKKYESQDGKAISVFKDVRTEHVFNAQQVQNAESYFVSENSILIDQDYSAVDRMIEIINPDIRVGGTASAYVPRGDYIRIPPSHWFETIPDFYTTKIHEITHWALSHPERLCWEGNSAMAEFVCEVATAIVMDHLQCQMGDSLVNCEGYLEVWLQEASFDANYLFSAFDVADMAANYLIRAGCVS